ncbi:CoA-substrate-specific enzyme activase, putative [Peptoniphilus asaccharolyticus DSM 20463]|uniref:CoA-substrate-specific enzyme activase, putative n=1 Tax=Peptoniphilus asaccharolyticus DSM 20463 TaxID=573058 RepID=A0A1W1VF09_PEPAS|nr:acyl-CoA dehydratase activase [Peptoniphilus asaccharolyticus]MBL7575922.1 CoA activase [Peptoniphilus asaccharolyticus]SMB91915.1 CoA-substrate-specific enzyme activase, putative [Peptoniphilus asaccharolyticus DSM 20463]
MKYVGIDIGSTASKVVIFDEDKKTILNKRVMSSGWNSKETAEDIRTWLESLEYALEDLSIVATGYGRVSVPYADKVITEITCHGKGASYLYGSDIAVIDIGGQDTKVIVLKNGQVADFIMNDKCSAGTGKFLEIMANRLGLSLKEMFEFAELGTQVKISSTCTVFAESEIISLMGKGTAKEDIAAGVVNSICSKVVTLVNKKQGSDVYFLTGGFCESEYVLKELSKRLGAKVVSDGDARFAGAIGAALLA